MVKIGFHIEISDPVFGPCFVQFYPNWSKYSPFLSRNTLLRDTLLLECKCEPGFPTDTHLLTLSPVYPFIPNCVLFNRAIYRKFVNFYFYRISMSYESLINLATFSVEFCILYAECPPYFYFRFVWPTDLESIPHASTPTSIIPTKFEAPTPIRSWVMSDNVFHWLPLKMRTRPLRMRRITWPVSRGPQPIKVLSNNGILKQLHFWNHRPQFAYSLYNVYWATTTIKGRLLSSVTNAKALDCVNFLCVTLWPWPLTFWPWTVVIHGKSRDQPRHQVRRPYAYTFVSYEW